MAQHHGENAVGIKSISAKITDVTQKSGLIAFRGVSREENVRMDGIFLRESGKTGVKLADSGGEVAHGFYAQILAVLKNDGAERNAVRGVLLGGFPQFLKQVWRKAVV